MDFAQCDRIAAELFKADELPAECRTKYPQLVRSILERRHSKRVDPFEGMWSGAALEARKARAGGREYHAQIQRRYTTTDLQKK
jgi:hypothetical protein